MNTILVPLDGSALAEQILPYVRGLAPSLSARVCLLRVLADEENDNLVADGIMWAYGIGDPPEAHRERTQRLWDTLRERAAGYLATVAMQLEQAGLDVETIVRIGPPDENIVEAARSQHATLIAMVTHGYGGLRRWTLGSVTDKVVHSATTPVFIVRGIAPAPPRDLALKRILVPLDGSELAKQALPLAAELATCANAELILLEAVAPTIEAYPGIRPVGRPQSQLVDVLIALRHQAKKELDTLAGELQRQHLSVKVAVVNGHAAEVIIDEAARRGADLIVMATHGYSGLRRWAMGSVADKVLHATTTSLILVRAQASGQSAVAE
jgi:nucleotide-binding universal stress UspA family protein